MTALEQNNKKLWALSDSHLLSVARENFLKRSRPKTNKSEKNSCNVTRMRHHGDVTFYCSIACNEKSCLWFRNVLASTAPSES